jgi:thiol-disulfide isomerase/thioredoxin
MKKKFPLVLGAILVLICGITVTFSLSRREPAPTPSGEPVPQAVSRAFEDAGLPVLRRRLSPADFSAPLPDGTVRKLSELRGKVVFLNFWATWCGPCRQEMPSMDALYQRFKSQGLEILAVNCQENLEAVTAYLGAQRFSFETVLDSSGNIGGAYGINALPTTFILDREGQIISRIVGSLDWNDSRILSAFETLLNNT